MGAKERRGSIDKLIPEDLLRIQAHCEECMSYEMLRLMATKDLKNLLLNNKPRSPLESATVFAFSLS